MKYAYDAEHTFRFDLDEPIRIGDREADRIRLEIQWVVGDEHEPETGWWVQWYLQGWPLTAKGTRDKRAKNREGTSHRQYPAVLRDIVAECWVEAVSRSGIDPDQIVNPGTDMLDPERYLA